MFASEKAGRRRENLFFSFSVIVRTAIRRCEIEICQSSLLTHPNESHDDRSPTPEANIPKEYAEYPSFLLLQLSTSSVNKDVWNIWRRRSKHCLWFRVDSNEHWNCVFQWSGKFNLLSIFSWVFLALLCLELCRFQCHSPTSLQVKISAKPSMNSTIFVHAGLYTDLDCILQSNDKFGVFLHCDHFNRFLT